MVSLNSAEVNFIAYGWDEDNKAAMSLRCFIHKNACENYVRAWREKKDSTAKRGTFSIQP